MRFKKKTHFTGYFTIKLRSTYIKLSYMHLSLNMSIWKFMVIIKNANYKNPFLTREFYFIPTM